MPGEVFRAASLFPQSEGLLSSLTYLCCDFSRPARGWGTAAPSGLCGGPLGLLPPLQPLGFELNIPRIARLSSGIGMEMAGLSQHLCFLGEIVAIGIHRHLQQTDIPACCCTGLQPVPRRPLQEAFGSLCSPFPFPGETRLSEPKPFGCYFDITRSRSLNGWEIPISFLVYGLSEKSTKRERCRVRS